MKKSISTSELREGMLVSGPHFKGLRVVVGPAYALAMAAFPYSRYGQEATQYRIRLADPTTMQAADYDFPDQGEKIWTLHDEDDTPDDMVECGTYGCKKPRPKKSIFCADCYQDYLEDPDAYK